MIDIYLSRTEEKESPAARALLLQVLEEEYGLGSPVILSGQQGKPFVQDGPCFSISHSRGNIAVAVSQGEVGLDLEQVRPYHEKLPRRIFSREELLWFEGRGETRIDFFTLWTLKESYFKYLGTGLPGFPNGTVFEKNGAWRLRGSDLFFTVLQENNLLLTVCSQEQDEIRIHRV